MDAGTRSIPRRCLNEVEVGHRSDCRIAVLHLWSLLENSPASEVQTCQSPRRCLNEVEGSHRSDCRVALLHLWSLQTQTPVGV